MNAVLIGIYLLVLCVMWMLLIVLDQVFEIKKSLYNFKCKCCGKDIGNIFCSDCYRGFYNPEESK